MGGVFTSSWDSTMRAEKPKKRAMNKVNNGESIQITPQSKNCFFSNKDSFFTPTLHLDSFQNSSSNKTKQDENSNLQQGEKKGGIFKETRVWNF